MMKVVDLLSQSPLRQGTDPNGVEVNVSRNKAKISILIHKDTFIATLIKMAHTPMAPVKIPRIADIKVSHEFAQVPQGSCEQKMEMIPHEDIAVELYSIYI